MTFVEEKFGKTYIPDADISSFTWTLANYKRLADYTDNCEFIESPKFVLHNHSYWIRLYPNGSSSYSSLDQVSAYVYYKKKEEEISEESNAPLPVKAKAYLCILTKSGEKRFEQSKKIFISWNESNWFIKELINKSEIMNPERDLLIDGSIKIRFELVLFEEIHVASDLKINLDKKEEWSYNMENQFLQTKFSDVKFVIADGGELPAHKTILTSRVPFFEKMFESNMKENTSNIVEITDIEFNVFKEMLRFIYTGKVKDIDAVASHLIKAADKYGIESLKDKCAVHLSKAMTIENVMNIIELANLYNVKSLKNQVFHFIKSDLAEKLASNDFDTMAVANQLPLLVGFLQSFK